MLGWRQMTPRWAGDPLWWMEMLGRRHAIPGGRGSHVVANSGTRVAYEEG